MYLPCLTLCRRRAGRTSHIRTNSTDLFRYVQVSSTNAPWERTITQGAGVIIYLASLRSSSVKLSSGKCELYHPLSAQLPLICLHGMLKFAGLYSSMKCPFVLQVRTFKLAASEGR